MKKRSILRKIRQNKIRYFLLNNEVSNFAFKITRKLSFGALIVVSVCSSYIDILRDTIRHFIAPTAEC